MSGDGKDQPAGATACVIQERDAKMRPKQMTRKPHKRTFYFRPNELILIFISIMTHDGDVELCKNDQTGTGTDPSTTCLFHRHRKECQARAQILNYGKFSNYIRKRFINGYSINLLRNSYCLLIDLLFIHKQTLIIIYYFKLLPSSCITSNCILQLIAVHCSILKQKIRVFFFSFFFNKLSSINRKSCEELYMRINIQKFSQYIH